MKAGASLDDNLNIKPNGMEVGLIKIPRFEPSSKRVISVEKSITNSS